jgi:RND family efflux transporter MFP subunit
MKRRNATLAPSFLLCAAVIGGLTGCASPQRTNPASPETVSNVSVAIVQKTTVPDWLEVMGTVRAAQTSLLSSRMLGTIVEMRAQEGQRVQSGQVLAALDDAQPRYAVEQATAAVTAAQKEVSAADSEFALSESTLKRYQQLFEKKSVSPQEFDEINARHQSAEARRDLARAGQSQAEAALAQARTTLAYAQIRAPFAGIVTERKADPGTLASPGMAIFTIEDTSNYRLEVTVDESNIRIVRAGQSVSISLDALGNAELAGKVALIVPAADPASRSFLVKIGLPADAHLQSGLFGRARFPLGERQALLIPRTAIVERGQLQGVYVIDANRMSGLRYVTLGKTTGQQVEVLSGLQDKERIVAVPGTRELGGKQIALQQ